MVVLQVSYRVRAHHMKAFETIFRDEIIPLVEDHGLKLRAFFRTLVGPMGEYTELWDFESVAQFETQWHQVMQDSRLVGIFERTGPMVEDEQLRLLEPVES